MSDFITNVELRIEAEYLCDENDRLKDENAKLRDYAYALEECKKSTHYCDGCPHNPEFEGGEPRCRFDFAALRAAAGMEVDE